jgi:hypothetical protein
LAKFSSPSLIATNNTVRSSTKALSDLRESGAIIETDVVMLAERDIHHVTGDLADDDLTADSPYQLSVPSLRRKCPEAAILSRSPLAFCDVLGRGLGSFCTDVADRAAVNCRKV